MTRAKTLTVLFIIIVLGGGFFLFTRTNHQITIGDKITEVVETVKEAVVEKPEEPIDPKADIAKQKPLANPPKVIKAIYATAWSASSEKKMAHLMDLLTTTELNAIVIDIKDYTGIISYEPDVPLVKEIGAFERRIPKINALIKRLHDNDIYVVARISTFQDSKLPAARPELAATSKSTGTPWKDRNGLLWADTASRAVWDYNISIARDALDRGFDEINFDYIRWPSDGAISDLTWPAYDGVTPKDDVVAQFFRYLRKQLPGAVISADLFGEVTYVRGPTGVGQNLSKSLGSFDVIAPMTYPSHYHPNFRGMDNSAKQPYEVLRYSMSQALDQLAEYTTARYENSRKLLSSNADATASSTPFVPTTETIIEATGGTTFRPWLQDFDMGATYTADMVRAQIRGVEDASFSDPNLRAEGFQNGWMLWDPSNNYTKAALLPE